MEIGARGAKAMNLGQAIDPVTLRFRDGIGVFYALAALVEAGVIARYPKPRLAVTPTRPREPAPDLRSSLGGRAGAVPKLVVEAIDRAGRPLSLGEIKERIGSEVPHQTVKGALWRLSNSGIVWKIGGLRSTRYGHGKR